VNRAWSLVAAAKTEGAGNVGLIQAVETLASRGIDLNAIKLPGAYLLQLQAPQTVLGRADLRKAILPGANLRATFLGDADLGGANLILANLSEAILRRAKLVLTDLGRADLSGADLSDAKLSGANFSGANLDRADLSGADLSGARGLLQQQLDRACGNDVTKVPSGLRLPPPCE
jgi:uncharacterized protein YjbI with pentapeptide repeats